MQRIAVFLEALHRTIYHAYRYTPVSPIMRCFLPLHPSDASPKASKTEDDLQ